ncbi:SusD/RagB family nutrient-binding outer membrane lipoprotein [Flavobacterium aestivum]|uniref:SusD/RagB family nutrient-binding outer membrane lipoprotein n=1 Tax=Flavobacterium aestivum TaxID=3003257 RepID=UPI0022857477|nr:SusD/RagB family nutrient-binding outer membrane lipoprotein [Flavobacterium aestivum]
MKKITIATFAISSLLFLASCSSDLTELNDNTKAFTVATPASLMASAQKRYADFLANADVNQNNFRMYAQQSCQTEYVEEANYNMTIRSMSDSNYINLYRDVLQDLNNAEQILKKEKTLSDEEVQIQKNKIAILEIQMVNAYQSLVDIFGNMPYSQALDINNLTPVYDNGETIYTDLINRLNIAIANLDTQSTSFGSSDLVYGGNVGKWKKYANCVKLKLGMHLVDVNPATAKATVESAYNSGLISSNGDNAVFKYLNADPNGNPFFNLFNGNPHYNPTQFLVNTLNGLNDPRIDKFLDPTSKIGGVYVGAVYGKKSLYKSSSSLNPQFRVRELPCLIFDYAETNLLLAEAAERGYNVGGTTESYYDKGITASMAYWGVASADVTNYLLQPSVAFATATGTPIQRIANQLWIAYFNRGFEAWTEYRRLDYPNLQAPPTAVAAANGKVPVRMIYSHLDKSQNSTNYAAASAAIGGDLMTTKLFWDKN